MKHLLRIIGAPTLVPTITTQVLQAYVDARSQDEGRHGKLLSEATMRKEIGTLASIWNRWALPKGLVSVPAPTKGLLFRKAKAKPPFQTWRQIERQIARGGVGDVEVAALWECLFLTLPEIDELLTCVRNTSRHEFVKAMFVFAAHTGARRSEMMRSRIDDFDFASSMVTLREKKKDASKELTFRHVPMSPTLREVMMEWFAIHPGGQLTICQKSDTPLSPQLAHHHLRWTLDESKWARIRGWHVFRHSFCSNCAMKGIRSANPPSPAW